MLLSVLSTIHMVTTLLFGVYISASILGILMNRKNILCLLAFSAIAGLCSAAPICSLKCTGRTALSFSDPPATDLIFHPVLSLFSDFKRNRCFYSLSVLPDQQLDWNCRKGIKRAALGLLRGPHRDYPCYFCISFPLYAPDHAAPDSEKHQNSINLRSGSFRLLSV